MKKGKLRSVLVLMLAASILFGTCPNAFGSCCGVAVDLIYQASECECEDDGGPDGSSWDAFWQWLAMYGTCTGWENDAILYLGGFRDAYTNESGYDSLTMTYETIGTKYSCEPDLLVGKYAACLSAAAVCGFACGVTWIGCVCVPGMIEVCQFCTTHACVADTNDPHNIYKYVITGFGEPCTG